MKTFLKLALALLLFTLVACSDSDGVEDPSFDFKETTEYKEYGLWRYNLQKDVKKVIQMEYVGAKWDEASKKVITGDVVIKLERQYNAKGLMTAEIKYYRRYDENGNPVFLISSSTTITYDARHRMIAQDVFNINLSCQKTTYEYDDKLGKVEVKYYSGRDENSLETPSTMRVYSLDKNGRIDRTQLIEFYNLVDKSRIQPTTAMNRAANDNTTVKGKYYKVEDNKGNVIKSYFYYEYLENGKTVINNIHTYIEQAISYFDGTQGGFAKESDETVKTYFNALMMTDKDKRGKVKSIKETTYYDVKWNKETQTVTDPENITYQYVSTYDTKGYVQSSTVLQIYYKWSNNANVEDSRNTSSFLYERDDMGRKTLRVSEMTSTHILGVYRYDKESISYDNANKTATMSKYSKKSESEAENLTYKRVYHLDADGMTASTYEYLSSAASTQKSIMQSNTQAEAKGQWELDYTSQIVIKNNADGDWIEQYRIFKYSSGKEEIGPYMTREFINY